MGILFPEELSGVAVVDEASGLSIAWLKDEPPLERTSVFVVRVGRQEAIFNASYKQSAAIVMAEFEGISVFEAMKRSADDRRLQLSASNISCKFDKGDFLRLWHRLIKSANPDDIVKVIYTEGGGWPRKDMREWSFGFE